MGKRKGPLAATKKKGGGTGGGGDFKKRTAKVGKRAVKQANVTKVNVRSKQLYMPTQRLVTGATSATASGGATAVAPGQERTAKGQALAELLHGTRHHNEGARTGAVQGLKELVTTFPGLGQREMAALLDGALELLLDPEEDVRRAALGLLRVLLLPSASPVTAGDAGLGGAGAKAGGADHRAGLLPFAPLAATYLCASLSHLDQSVRRDGLAYLDLLVQSLGPHLLPHAGEILPSLAALLDKPPHPSKRQAARLLLQQKQAAAAQAQGQGGDDGAISAKEKDQQLKARMELWAARAGVLRCALGLARLLPHQQQQSAASAVVQHQQAPSTPAVVVEWRRTPRLLLLRPTQPPQPQEAAAAVVVVAAAEEDGPDGGLQSVEGLGALLPRVRNYVLELSTGTGAGPTGASASASAMDVDGDKGGGQPTGGQGQGRHQVEGGPALDALAGAIEFALVATQCLAASVAAASAGAGEDGDWGEEGEEDAVVAVAVGEARALIGALVALFPLQLADGATALRTSVEDEDENEGEEGGGGGIVTEDGLNLALAEMATLGATAIDSGFRGGSKKHRGGGGGLDTGVVAWLLGFMARRAKALGGGGTAEGERLGARLLRLLRGLLPRLYRRGEERVAERLVASLETCADAWPLAAPNKRAALRLLCDLLPSRPQSAAHAWVERTARTQLPQWAAAGQGALVAPVVVVLLRVVATGASGEEGYPWLPEAVTALLSSLGGLQGQGQRQRQLGLRVCDLLYHCPAWPPELQEAVVGVVHGAGAGEGGLLVDYLVEILHHRRQVLSPSAYLTLLGRLLTVPASTPLPHAAAVGATVGRVLRQLQQRPGSVLPLLAPLLVRLLGNGDDREGSGDGQANAATRLAALVVVVRVGGSGEEKKKGALASGSSPISLPPALVGPLVAAALGRPTPEEDDNDEEDDDASAAFAGAGRPLLLALLRRHGPQLLPPLVEHATPSVLSSSTPSGGAARAFQEWLREPGLNWAPAREGLAALRARCLGQLPRLQGMVHDLDLLPLGLGK